MIEQSALNVLNELEKNKIHRMYLLSGKEGTYLKIQIVKKIKDRFVDEQTEAFDFIELNGEDTTALDVLNALSSVPLGRGKLVVLKDADKAASAEMKKIYSIEIPSFSVLVIISQSKRGPKISEGDAVIVSKYAVTAELTRKWIKDRCGENGKEISSIAINDLMNRVDGDFFLLLSEINKLALFIGERKKIEQDDVEKVVKYIPETKIFALIDAVVAKKKRAALKMLNQMLSVDAASINLTFFWLLKTSSYVILIKEFINNNGHKSAVSASKELNIPLFSVHKLLPIAEKFTFSQLVETFHALEEIDVKSKTGEMDLPLAFKLFIQSM